MQAGSPEFDSSLNKMMASLHHHNDDEEIDDLPLLEPIIGETASKEAAQSFKQTKKFVPTRYVFQLSSGSVAHPCIGHILRLQTSLPSRLWLVLWPHR